MRIDFRAKIAKQGNRRIIIVPKEYEWDVEAFVDKLLHVELTTIEQGDTTTDEGGGEMTKID